MYDFTFSRWQILPAEPLSIIARRFIRVIIVIKIEESLNFVEKLIYKEYFKLLNSWFGSVYAFHKPLHGLF
jgi:hypothetical protein